MTKYSNRIKSEFEAILLKLSYDSCANYSTAVRAAREYVDTFCKKCNLKGCKDEIFTICHDMIENWYPDTSSSDNIFNCSVN